MPDSTSAGRHIIVVGAGCFGLSTALHLLRQSQERRQSTCGRHISVTIFDVGQDVPAAESASNDSSRIVRADYTDPIYATLGKEALNAWRKDPTFRGAFSETGWIFAALPGNDWVSRARQTLTGLSNEGGNAGSGTSAIETVNAEQVRTRFKGLTGPMADWDMYFNPEAGWANPRQAIQAALREFLARGGKLVTGISGHVTKIITDDGPKKRAIGVRTSAGREHRADQILLSAGSMTPSLVDTGHMIHPSGFAVAHWQLNEDELKVWKDHPVVDLHRHGYFFPPNDQGVMKMGFGMAAFTNTRVQPLPDPALLPSPLNSVPLWANRIPPEAEQGIRWVLAQSAPELASKPFFDMKICWDGMTEDGDWIIAEDPGTQGLFVASGGSGHAFKMFPTVGKYVADLLQGRLAPSLARKWCWRDGNPDPASGLSGRPLRNLARLKDFATQETSRL